MRMSTSIYKTGNTTTFIGLFITLCCTPLLAAYPEELRNLPSEEDFLLELPVVLSATRLIQPVSEAPVATTIIDREMIEASGYTRIADLFRLVPGMQVVYESGNDIAVTYHGLSDNHSRRMQVLIDGRSVYVPSTGGVPWADLPLLMEDIERIEVVRGPNAAAYGANSFQGIINIITRHASETVGTLFKSGIGTDGYRKAVLRHGGSTGDLDYRVSLAYQQDDGFDGRYDSQHSNLVTSRFDYQAGINDLLQFQAGLSEGPRLRGSEGNISSPPHRRFSRNHFQQLSWQHIRGQGHESSLKFSHHFNDTNEAYHTAGKLSFSGIMADVSTDINIDYTDQRYDLEYQQSDVMNDGIRLVWAANARRDTVQSDTYFNTPDTIENNLYRLFGHFEWRIEPAWLLNIGGIVEKDDLTDWIFSPRLALNHHINPNHSVRISYTQATRTPVLFEEYINEIAVINFINPPLGLYPLQVLSSQGGLKPEHITAYEIGYIAELLAKQLELDAKLSYEEMTHLIGTDKDVYQNLDDAYVSAIELEARYRPSSYARLIANYAYIDINSSDNSNDGLEKSAPRHSFTVFGMLKLDHGYHMSAHYHYIDKIKSLTTPDITGPIRRLDLRVSKQFAPNPLNGQVNLTLQNALDADYSEYRHDNPGDRRIQMELLLNL